MVEMEEIGCMFMWISFGLVRCCGVFCLVGGFVVLLWWRFGVFSFPLNKKKRSFQEGERAFLPGV